MPTVIVNKDMDIETAIKIFKSKCRKEGLYEEFRRKEYWMTKSEAKRARIKANKRKRELKTR
jgi:ribosomal protein S21